VAERIAALVPMRHESERVRGKNYRPLGGRPLFHHVVEALLGASVIDEVVIDTDSPTIARDVAERFPQLRVLPRPTHLLGGDVPMNDVLLHDVTQVDADLYVQTHSTNPFLTSATIEDAVGALLDAGDAHDSLFTVTALQTRLWTADGRPLNHDPDVLLRTQDLPPVMEENSCLYVFGRETLERRRNRLGDRPLMYVMPREEAWPAASR